jgi:transposase
MSEPAAMPIDVPPPRSRAAARQTWIERLARFASAGLSPAQFCATEGVSLPSFYAWKRRLAVEALQPADQGPAADASPRLLPVRLPTGHAAIELVLPGGTLLRLPPGCDLAFVRALVQALGGEPC